ncbi:PREDICTED: uncharacterized protein LOC108569554 [Nicrophorus vespilloides]|uniref:Uncharacterized protein LOC108569554 n=1 Tax=Nicrophorus vespilloides TaxID=110193 RepID=A0ABM1NII0_NICVS|nr:PREDICTED: uncharacterized protein LOC108569554 [Nicrophorus vespilloides]
MNHALYLKDKYDHSFRTNNTFHWFIMSYTKTLNLLIQNIFFGFNWESTFEYIICTILIILGFNVQMVIFVAKLTSAYIHQQLMYFAFKIKMQVTAMFLEDLNVDEGLRQRAMEYCDKLWMLRYGNLTTPASFMMLPISLQKDISIDIFWDALQHSQLFEEVSMSLKRVISLKMRNIFLMPGTYLYKKGQIKSQMIYVVSGNIQVLSSEDNVSPILNLTCGTVLGEINTLISTRSTVNLYTANGCTLHILDLPDLFHAITQSKHTSNELKRQLNKRIKLVKEMRIIKQQMVSAYETMEDKYNTPIKRLKTNWHMVWNFESQQNLDIAEIKEKLDVSYCSKFLNLLVMTESLGSNMLANSICIQNSFPFVVEPNSSFRKTILYISLGSTVINAAILPFCISFLNELPRILYSYCLLLDVACWLELYFELITAIKTPTVTITAPIEIFLTKIKTPKFFVDLFASLPIDYFVFWNSDNLMYASMCRLNRLIRVYRIYIVLHEWDESIIGNVTVKKICKYAIYYTSTIYFCTCMLYSIACPGECLRYCKQL